MCIAGGASWCELVLLMSVLYLVGSGAPSAMVASYAVAHAQPAMGFAPRAPLLGSRPWRSMAALPSAPAAYTMRQGVVHQYSFPFDVAELLTHSNKLLLSLKPEL